MSNFPISEFLTNTASKLNFKREKFIEKNVPTNFDQISVFFALGDLRSTVAVSTMLLPRIRKEKKALRYFIVFGYPQFSCLYPYADEYWSFNSEEKIEDIYYGSSGLDNFSNLKTTSFIQIIHESENHHLRGSTEIKTQLIKQMKIYYLFENDEEIDKSDKPIKE